MGRIPQRDLGRGQTLADEALELRRKLDARAKGRRRSASKCGSEQAPIDRWSLAQRREALGPPKHINAFEEVQLLQLAQGCS